MIGAAVVTLIVFTLASYIGWIIGGYWAYSGERLTFSGWVLGGQYFRKEKVFYVSRGWGRDPMAIMWMGCSPRQERAVANLVAERGLTFKYEEYMTDEFKAAAAEALRNGRLVWPTEFFAKELGKPDDWHPQKKVMYV